MKYPGDIPDPAMEDWFANDAGKNGFVEAVKNPCIKLHGKGPDGARCKTCKLIYQNRSYFKCELRVHTNGPGSDHRANWPACGKFVKDEP